MIESLMIAGGAIFVTAASITWLKRLIASRREFQELKEKSELYDLAPQLASLPPGYEKLIDQLQESLKRLLGTTGCRFRVFESTSEAAEVHGDDQAAVLKSGNYIYVPGAGTTSSTARVLLPLATAQSSWGVLTIEWLTTNADPQPQLELLQRLARLLNIKAQAHPSALQSVNSTCEQLRGELRQWVREQGEFDGIDQLIPQLYATLRRCTSFEILRLGSFEARGSIVRQYCLGSNGNLLNEIDRSIVNGATEIRKLFSTMSIRRCSTLSESEHDDLRFLGTCGAEWSVSIPLGDINKVDAVLTLAGSGQEIDDETAELIREETNATILPLIRHDNLKRELDLASRNFLKLGNALRVQSESRTPEQALQALAKSIVTELPSSLCQIWMFDSARNTLTPVARAQAASVSALVRIAQTISIDETLWHKRVVDEGRYMIVNQQSDEFKMMPQEIALTGCPEMKSALLVPIMTGKRIAGVITICEVRENSRRNFTLTDIKLAQGIALIVAQMLSREIFSETLSLNSRINLDKIPPRILDRLETLERNKIVGEVFADLPRRLATPLTSIMARSDILMQTVDDKNGELANSLRTIKRQAEKITAVIRDMKEYQRNEIAMSRRSEKFDLSGLEPVESDSKI